MTIALDTSSILALIKNEPGADTVLAALGDAVVCTANVAEVYSFFARNGLPRGVVDEFMAHRGLEIAPLSLAEAELAGSFVEFTRAAGLSLGDRCCLALAKLRGIVALTADRPWLQFSEPLGVKIELIR